MAEASKHLTKEQEVLERVAEALGWCSPDLDSIIERIDELRAAASEWREWA